MTSTRENEVSEQELLPCPFCGGQGAPLRSQMRGYFIECVNDMCGSSGGGFGTKEESIAAWNHRSPTPPAAGGVVVPSGWQLVPVNPTKEMCRAGLAERHDDLAKSIYAAMLAAAPQQSAQGGWLPIESAPEGSFLVSVRGSVFGAFRRGDSIIADYSSEPFANAPTHWQPLPAPPKTAGG